MGERRPQYRNHPRANFILRKKSHTKSGFAAGREGTFGRGGCWICMSLTLFSLEDRVNGEPCRFPVLSIVAEIDPYVEVFPQFSTYIFGLCYSQWSIFQSAELHFMSCFNVGLNTC